jgi:thiol-disulfide isomerase/thioredoxin
MKSGGGQGEGRILIRMRIKLSFAFLTLASLLLCVGIMACSRPAAPSKRTLTEVDADGLRQAIASRNGKVVFVTMWATWCAPCVAEFPDIVTLYGKYHAKGLEVIAVSLDTEAARAIPFLDKQKAEFVNLLKSGGQDDDAFKRSFEADWLDKEAGALPASWLFDQAGRRKYFHVGKFDPPALDRQIGELLAGR